MRSLECLDNLGLDPPAGAGCDESPQLCRREREPTQPIHPRIDMVRRVLAALDLLPEQGPWRDL